MAISRTLRFQVLRRDGHRCHYCGATAAQAKLTVDHVTAVALGGTDTADNLVAACEPCNGGKSATPADAALVAGVQERQQEFQTALTGAVEQDRQQRWFAEAFLDAWNAGDGGELPPGWKRTIDAYRQSGLTPDAWAEIVEIALTKPGIEDRFRYSCGVARGKVKKIQEQAARNVRESPTSVPSLELDAISRAAVEVWRHNWLADHETAPDAETVARFEESVAKAQGCDVMTPNELLATAALGGCEQKPTINEALGSLMKQERADIVIEWADAWCSLADVAHFGGAPESFLYGVVQGQVDELVNFGVPRSRIRHAAIIAGYHRSTELHHGLREQDLRHTGVQSWQRMAADAWARAFRASADRWPADEERAACVAAIDSEAYAPGDPIYFSDLIAAAAAAGAYQDPSISTCLPQQGSVFAAAAAIAVPVPA